MYNFHKKAISIILLIAMVISLSAPIIVNASSSAPGSDFAWDFDNKLQGVLFEPFSGGVADVYIKGPDSVVSSPGATASYYISIEDAPTVNVIELEIEFDGDYLSPKDFATLNGFIWFGMGNFGTPIYWKQEANIWIGKTLLIHMDGINGDADIMQMNFDVQEGAVGDAGVKLNYVVLAYAGYLVDSSIVQDTAITSFIKYYSPYDANKDGVVDALDISLVLLYLLSQRGDYNWDEAQKYDFDDNVVIDIGDLILLLANYTIPFYD